MFNFFKKKREEKTRQEEAKLKQIEREKELERRKVEENILKQKKLQEEINYQIDIDKKNISIEEVSHMLQIVSNIKSVIGGDLERETVIIDYNSVKRLFVNSYKDTYMIDEVSKFETYVNNNIRKLIFEYLGINYDMLSNDDLDYNTKMQIKQDATESFNEELNSYNFEDIVYDILNNTKELTFDDPIVDRINEDYQKEDAADFDSFIKYDTPLSYKIIAKYKVRLIIHLVNNVMGMLYLMILSRQKNNFIENNELFNLAKNLFGEFDEDEAIDKFFNIYEELYDNELKQLEKNNFFNYANIKNKKKLLFQLMIRFSFEVMNNNNVVQYYKNVAVDNEIFKKFDVLTNKVFEEMIFKYLLKGLDNKIIFRRFYSFMIINYVHELKTKDLIKYIFDWWDIESYLKERRKKIEIEEEKKRYLKGDFSKERNLEREKLNFSNINDGIGFENYLKVIFEKMGYLVETTKTTGDQGADLIVSKDGIKTVVQAKFYSSTVGNKAIQEVTSAIAFYNANRGMVITNNYYTKSAIELANANNIILWDYDILQNKINEIINLNNSNKMEVIQ